MRAVCKHLSIAEATGGEGIDVYRDLINPIDYDFGLEKDREYLVFGMSFRRSSVWLYVVHSPGSSLPDISVVPAALFTFSASGIPSDMVLTVSASGCEAEIVPVAAASFAGWYERYVDEEPEVVRAVAEEIFRRSAVVVTV